MSFQFIHTSAKRGLEPGKSGFCCVARDRSLPPDLIAELESQSRYTADSQGASPLILRHRIVTLRSGTYHILSRIQEAGTDYSKRNNHIAHHIAFSQEDTPGLPNPAAILLNWRGWRDKWDEPPRILEPFEAFDLQDIESFWATQKLPESFKSVTLNGSLLSRIFKISIREERLLIEHLRRSINDLQTNHRWTHAFTSCLLPTDQPHDYPWAGFLPSLPLPYDLPTANLPLKLATPNNAPTEEPKAPQSQQPSSIAEPQPETPEPPKKKFTAPKVEIPEEYDHRKRKRPKRNFGQREFSRSINIAITGGAIICIALVLFFVQSHKSSNLTQSDLQTEQSTQRSLQARQAVWTKFAKAGYPRSELENARATANFLAQAGEDTPLQTITFLDQLLAAAPEDQATELVVPKHLIQSDGTSHSIPLSVVSYPPITKLALLPSELAKQLDFPQLEKEQAPLSAMPHGAFSTEALTNALESYLLLANVDYEALPQQTLEALNSYFTQLEEIRSNHQFAPVLSLSEHFGLDSDASYIATDELGLLIPNSPMSLAQYLRELITQHVYQSSDLALQSTAFRTTLAQIQSNTRATPAETAAEIHQALSLLNLDSRDSQDPWRKLRIQWQYTFTHPDLMEQTIIGYNLDALEAAKLRLAETRSHFSQAELTLHKASQDRASKANSLKEAAKEAASSKEWIVISKHSTKFPNSLP